MNILDSFKDLQGGNKKIILIAIIVVLLLYLDFSFVLKPQINAVKKIGPLITKVKNDLNNINRDLTNMQNLKAKQAKTKSSTIKVKKIISEDQIAGLLESISEIGNRNNIRIMQIRPVKEIKTREATPVKETSNIKPLLINLDLVSSYHNFGAFLNEIEDAPELMSAESIQIESDPQDYFKQKVSLVLKAYVEK